MQSDWNALGEVLYRKIPVYEMKWKGSDNDNLHIDDYLICGAPFGGPLAMIRDDKKLVPLSDENMNPKLRIFTSSGNLIAEIEWNEQRKVIGMGWSDQERLVIVFEDGNAVVYDIHGVMVKNFVLSPGDATLVECHFWGNGVVGLSADMQLFVYEGLVNVEGDSGSRKYTLNSGLSATKPYTSMAIVPPLLSRSGLLEVILGTPDSSIIVVDENDFEDQLLQDRIGAPISKIAVAPNGKFLACFRRDGVLTVLSVTFTTKVLDFDTKSKSRPMEVTWCGDDAVVLLWKNTGIVMVGPYGDWLNYPYEGSVTVISELDCCRIVTSTSCEILQRVPPSTEAIRRIGSTDPAALLFDAMEGYLEGDPKSDDNIRSIALTNQLQYAVKSCIAAASAEFDIVKQQQLFRAASYGKAFCQNFDSNEFVETGQRLRVLNDIRKPEIGLPLTIQEYTRLTPEVLVNRLTIRNHHFLALKICELLKLPNESVLIHWASEKVKKLTETTSTDEEITSLITYKLRPYNRISYLDIATAAYQMGRRKLATMLLELESNASDQVPLLLSMNEVELALKKAMTSDDNDLIYLTLIHLERSEPNSDNFYRLLAQYPEALNLLKIYYQHKTNSSSPADGSGSTPLGGQSFLMNFYQSHRNYYEAALLTLTSAYHSSPSISPAQSASAADQQKSAKMKEAISIFSQSKDLLIYKTYTEEEIDLIEFQKTLELRLSSSPNHHRYDFTNMSISETLENIYIISIENEMDVQRWNQEANKLIKKFKVSEKMVWYLRINCYAKFGQWDYLMKLANEKRSPVGYKPFAIACQKYGQSDEEIEKYMDRISSSDEKYEVYVQLAMWRRAAEVANKMKDLHKLQQVARCCRDPNMERQIQEMIARS